MKAFIALCLVAVVVAQRALPLSLEEEQFEFLSFVSTFNKKYEDNSMFFKRFNAFRVELNEIRQHNAGNHTWFAGINEWSDLSREEFFQVLACDMTPTETIGQEMERNPNNANDIDWTTKGAVNAVKNQGQCGSCWAFGAIAALEGYTFVKTQTLHNLAEQQLVDCSGSTGNQGCNGGMPDRALKYLNGKGAGACKTANYPYTAKGGACKDSSCPGKVPANPPNNLKGEQALETILNSFPVSVAIDASSAFSRYSGGIFSGPCSSTSINHAVTAVGYNSESWKVRNSWGTSWGTGGYIQMKRGMNICNINNYITAAGKP